VSDAFPVKRPRTALGVAELSRSLGFYVDLPGFALERRDAAGDLAWLDAAGYPVLLAGPAAGDLAAQLTPDTDVLAPGGTLHALGVDLDELARRLGSLGIAFEMVERSWGDRVLRFTDPDGYRIAFEAPARWSSEEAMRHYAAGARALEEVVAGLDASGLDVELEPSGWTARQVVHHLADTEALTYPALLAALAEPGREWRGNPWSPDRRAGSLDYRYRPVAPSLALFAATRASVLELLERLPARWGQATRSADGTPHPTVVALVGMLAGHALEHIEQIRSARRRMER